MGKVSFDLGFKSAELKRLDLPIEIRKPNQTLVARVLASQSVDLEKGTYFVTAKLPAGQELVERLDVTGDQTMTLSPALEDESPRASAEVAHYLGRGGGRTRFRRSFLQQQLTETLPASDAPVSPNAYLRVFSGNVLDGTYVLENAAAELTRLPQEAADTLQFSLRGAEKIKTVQLVQPGQIPVNICSAAPSGARGVIVINQAESGEFRIDAHLHHALADSLLRYYK